MRRISRWLVVVVCIVTSLFGLCTLAIAQLPAQPGKKIQPGEDALVLPGKVGARGGRLVASFRAEPKTLNPVTATDLSSKEVIALLSADLIHINEYTQRTEPALAKSWKVSHDGKTYTLELRRGISFSDGRPFDADDVIFSFKVYLDEKLNSPQRDLLQVGGKPIQVRKLGPYRVLFEFPQPYAAAERLFDSVSILPRHLLQPIYEKGGLAQTWNITTSPSQMAGLGPFRLKQYTPGQQLVLERNPYYWKVDTARIPLPYLDELVFLTIPSADAEVIRFQAGDLDVIDNISAENYTLLLHDQAAKHYSLHDLGPGLEYDFIFFNLNDLSSRNLPEISRKQQWFRREEFRQAVSAAIDREAMVRLVYQGRATAIWGQVTPGNKLWIDTKLPHPPRSLEHAEALLRSAGFTRDRDGRLKDQQGTAVEFSTITSSSNIQRTRMAALVQSDLGQLGMQVHVVPLESQSLSPRVFDSFDYEACMLALKSGDADPNPEIGTWTSGGNFHLWALTEAHPATPWQAELDRLMQLQTTVLDYKKRKEIYDRVQVIIAQHEPMIFLLSPNVLVGAKDSIEGIKPAVLGRHLLWNAEQLFLKAPSK